MFRIEFERRRRGLTQRQLGDLAGMVQTHVSMLERGRLNPTDDELLRLANALRVSPPSALLHEVLASDLADADVREAASAR